MNYIAGGSQDDSSKRAASVSSKKNNINQEPAEEYNNFDKVRNSHSVISNKKTDDNSRSFKERHNSGNVDHAKSMGLGDGSSDDLLIDDDAPVRNLKEKVTSHSSFHKRPLSHTNGAVRAKSSRQKRRKKTPVHSNNKQQNTLISNNANSNSKLTQDVTDTEEGKTKKLIDDSKFGNKKAVVNASNRPKSSRGNRSFDNNSNSKVMGKTDVGFKHKRNSVANNPKPGTSFGKKKNSYGGQAQGQLNADKLLAKYRQTRGSEGVQGVSASFSMNNLEQPNSNLVNSIKEKNSRNIEKFGEKAILNSNSIADLTESNSQYMINSDNIKGDKIPQNMSFETNHKQRLLKPKKKNKEEANKALLNFEDMKRKILKDYVKKNGKELVPGVVNPSHHRNGGGLISNYLTQLDEYDKAKDARINSRTYSNKEKELLYMSEAINAKKKNQKKPSKDKFNAIYEGPLNNHWTNQPLSQKSINTNMVIPKDRPNSNKKHTPSKKSQPKSASKYQQPTIRIYSRKQTEEQREYNGHEQFICSRP